MAVDPQGEFWSDAADVSSWRDVQVLGARNGMPRGLLVYRTRFTVPKDFEGKRVILRFDGVSGLAKVWVNPTVKTPCG